MGVTIGELEGFCICDIDEQAIEQDYINLRDFSDRFRHMCKRTLREWEQVTGISQERQVEFAERCWVARTKANEERERAESERVRIEAEEERVQLQTLDAQMREDVSFLALLNVCVSTH